MAVRSQHTCQRRRLGRRDSPGSSWPPIQHAERPYGLTRRRQPRGRLKIETINISQTQKVEKTYLQRARAAQPRRNISKRLYRVNGPRWQCGRTKIEPTKLEIERLNDKIVPEDETTHLGRAHTTQPPGHSSKRLHRVHRPRRRRGRIKFIPINVNGTETSGNTYLGRGNAIQPIWRPGKQIRRVSKLTIECRMPGEPWRDVEDHG